MKNEERGIITLKDEKDELIGMYWLDEKLHVPVLYSCEKVPYGEISEFIRKVKTNEIHAHE